MEAKVIKQNSLTEFFIEEGCHIIELCNDDNDADVSIARARVAPGVTTQWHQLKGTTERYVIMQGKGRVEIGDLPASEMISGDTVVIPAMCRQRITNIGDTDLIFLAICSPRFQAEAYQAL